MPASYVYALGGIGPRFPRLSVEKEFAQATGRAETVNLTDRQALRQVLEQNRYLVKQLCWVMTVGGLETYIVVPRDPTDWSLLVETLRPNPHPRDVDLVVGMRGPLAPPEMCNGLSVPIIAFDQLYSFDRDSLIGSIPRPERVAAERFREAAGEVFDRIMQLTDNAGATDEHRALNYLTVRYPVIYAAVAQAQGRNSSLTAVDVRPSALSGVRNIVEVIFSFTDRATDVVEKQFLRVDVTEEFPAFHCRGVVLQDKQALRYGHNFWNFRWKQQCVPATSERPVWSFRIAGSRLCGSVFALVYVEWPGHPSMHRQLPEHLYRVAIRDVAAVMKLPFVSLKPAALW
jgi:PatG Domain